MSVLELIGQGVMVFGAVVFAVAALGVLTLPDLYTRISAIGTCAGVGIGLIVIGVVLQDLTVANVIKGLVALLLQLSTSAIGATLIARAAVMTGHEFCDETDLSDAERLEVLVDREHGGGIRPF